MKPLTMLWYVKYAAPHVNRKWSVETAFTDLNEAYQHIEYVIARGSLLDWCVSETNN